MIFSQKIQRDWILMISHIAMVLIHIMIHTLVGNSLLVRKLYGMKVNHSMQ